MSWRRIQHRGVLSRKIFIPLFCIIAFIFLPSHASAQQPYELLAPLPEVFFPAGNLDFVAYLTGYFRLGLAVAGVLAVIMIIVGGVQIMTTDSIYNKTEGRSRIQHALLGLLLAFAAWLILNTINPQLVTFRPKLGGTTDINVPISR